MATQRDKRLDERRARRVFVKRSIMDEKPTELDGNAIVIFELVPGDANSEVHVRFTDDGRVEVRTIFARMDVRPEVCNVITVGRVD